MGAAVFHWFLIILLPENTTLNHFERTSLASPWLALFGTAWDCLTLLGTDLSQKGTFFKFSNICKEELCRRKPQLAASP